MDGSGQSPASTAERIRPVEGRRLGLRSKAVLALLVALGAALLPATLIGWQVIASLQSYLGEAYARNLSELSRQRILAPILQERVLGQRFAQALYTQTWLQNEADPEARTRFFAEAEVVQRAFRDRNYFVISDASHRYYFNQASEPYRTEPRYTLDPASADDRWYFNLRDAIDNHNINVNHDVALGTTRVWINIPARTDGQLLGLVGTGLDLTRFIGDFLRTGEQGVTPMIVNGQGAIQAHPDADRIALGSGAGVQSEGGDLAALFGEDGAAVRETLEQSARSEEVRLLQARLEGRPHLLAVAYLAELDWYLITAVDLSVAQLVSGSWWISILAGVGLVILVLLAAVALAVERLLINPLSRLQRSATAIAEGDYTLDLPRDRGDEIGDLSRAFASMVTRVQRHTEELEFKVSERTRALENSNREIRQINKTVSDSIDYARLIQRAILPDSALQRALGADHFVLWKPRDTVGGDFYFFHSEQGRHLIGLVDCAGHGVPGALMTMLARAAFDHVIREAGLDSPARLLQRADQVLRAMLQDLELPRALATNMDVGLVTVDPARERLTFAGAKIALQVAAAQGVRSYPGTRRALVSRRPGHYQDLHLTLDPQQRFFLTSDGYLDQAGGERGFGMGTSGFIEAIAATAELPLARQGEALWARLQSWQGDYLQRDDICIIGFQAPRSATG